MTQKEILQYNKRCAEFLGAIYSEAAEAWGFGNAKNIGSKMFQGVMYHNVIEAERFEKELKFHSDWNWIHEVIEAIKNLKETVGSGKGTKMVTKFDITNNSVTIAFENGDFYDTIHVGHTDNGKYFKMEGDVDTPKEAVVQAIYQFLIWYEQNKTT